MAHHNLKSFVKQFEPLIDGKKNSEVRLNDRNYKIGDTITHLEGQYSEGEFELTGRTRSSRITYVDDFGCQFGYVNLSIERIDLLILEENNV